jgi:hypothetical protein
MNSNLDSSWLGSLNPFISMFDASEYKEKVLE